VEKVGQTIRVLFIDDLKSPAMDRSDFISDIKKHPILLSSVLRIGGPSQT